MARIAQRTPLLLALAAGWLLGSCRTAGSADSTELQDLPGLEVEGPRSRANVVANLRPVLVEMQRVFAERRRLDPGLAGRIELFLTVESNGEIGIVEVRESTFADPALEGTLLLPVGYTDFDSWGRFAEDTEIVWPITFGEPE